MTIGGLKKTSSPLALVAAAGFLMGGMALTPASAADLGGDCCADLEERVAELEATTARKGNRKVSLTISGHVARVMGYYEDEYDQSEWYSAGCGPSGSRLQFAGSAQLTNRWSVGYTLRLRFSGDRSSDVLNLAGHSGGGDGGFNNDHNTNRGHGGSLGFDRNYIWFKNKRLGTLVLGEAGLPTGGVATIALGGRVGDSGGDSWNRGTVRGFNLEDDGSDQVVAYVSPTIMGFTLSVAWADLDIDTNQNGVGGSDDAVDNWDMALRYAGEFGPIRLAAGIGYQVADNDELGDGSAVMGSLAFMHTPTGINLNFAAGTEVDGGMPGGFGNGGAGTDARFWHIAGGISQNFTSHGATSIYGEYGNYDYDLGMAGDDVDMWGIGVVQKFDKAATEVFIAYRQWDGYSSGAGTVNGNLNDGDINQLMAGAKIKF